jgi:phosphopantothenoylcysteine decarboxylase/phosphopantothenate--cysteine ligase
MSGSNIAFVLTGSIAAYKACDVISQLVQCGHRVRTVTTGAALRFVGESTLEGLTGERVATDLFTAGAALEHIELTRWADAVVVCPATANTLNRFAAGLAGDLAGALFLAHDWKKPFLVAPAMNPAMWRHPATAASVRQLQEWGVRMIAVGEGRTACGEIGEGRMAEPAEIVAAIESSLARPARRLRVLVTSGGTSEPIDGVRVLTNTSTGHTGAGIAAYFARCGHEVLLLRARGSIAAGGGCREETFFTFADLDDAWGRLLGEEDFDAVIHAAAVGDFGLEAVEMNGRKQPVNGAKLDSEIAPVLRLRRQPKLVEDLRDRSRNGAVLVVAFKLTSGTGEDEVRSDVQSLIERAAADLVVHNDLAARSGQDAFPADIYRRDCSLAAHCNTRTDVSCALERLLTALPVTFST